MHEKWNKFKAMQSNVITKCSLFISNTKANSNVWDYAFGNLHTEKDDGTHKPRGGGVGGELVFKSN